MLNPEAPFLTDSRKLIAPGKRRPANQRRPQVASLYEESRLLETEIAVVGYDQMVDEFNAEQAPGELKLPRNLPIFDARPHILGRMIVLCGVSSYVNSRAFLSSFAV